MKTKDKQIHSKTKNDKKIESSQSPCAERFAPQFKIEEPGEHETAAQDAARWVRQVPKPARMLPQLL